jgi:hypothetical protein
MLDEEKIEEKFDDWNELKKDVHFDEIKIPQYSERDIWFITMGQNIGSEIYGKGQDHLRPVLILKKFGKSFIGIPLTSKQKSENNKFFMYLGIFGESRKENWVCLSQLRLFDAKRLWYRTKGVNKITSDKMDEVKKSIQELIFY